MGEYVNPEMVNASEESIFHTPFTASTMTNIKKALACIALATTSVAATQFASQAHSIGYRNHWNYVGQTHSGKTVYAKVRRVHWNYGPKVTYSRLKVKRNGRRRYQTVTAMCDGSGLYRVNRGYFKRARHRSFRRFEINRVCANRRAWRYGGGMLPAIYRGSHIH